MLAILDTSTDILSGAGMFLLTLVIGVTGYLLKRLIDKNDESVQRLDTRVAQTERDARDCHAMNEKLNSHDGQITALLIRSEKHESTAASLLALFTTKFEAMDTNIKLQFEQMKQLIESIKREK